MVVVSDGTDSTEFTTPAITVENARPQAVRPGLENPTSLTDLIATIETQDADGDAVVVSTTWYKTASETPASPTPPSCKPTDSHPSKPWRLVVVASDGTETSDSIESTITLVNLEPTATIQLLSSNVWYNETTVLSGAASSTPTARTSATIGRGQQEAARAKPGFGADGEHGCHADHHGRTRCNASNGPVARHRHRPRRAKPAGHQRRPRQRSPSWSWTGEQAAFNILRNGVLVGSTNATDYEDQPPISGTVTYTVQPFDEERTYLGASDSISPMLDPIRAEEPGPATGLGLGLGALLILALLVLPLLGRRGGER